MTTLFGVFLVLGFSLFVCVAVLSLFPDLRYVRALYRGITVNKAIRSYDCVAKAWGRYQAPKPGYRAHAMRFHLLVAAVLVSAMYCLRGCLCALIFVDCSLFLMLYATFMLKFLKPRLTVFERQS